LKALNVTLEKAGSIEVPIVVACRITPLFDVSFMVGYGNAFPESSAARLPLSHAPYVKSARSRVLTNPCGMFPCLPRWLLRQAGAKLHLPSPVTFDRASISLRAVENPDPLGGVNMLLRDCASPPGLNPRVQF
jgi:hypothetical protein